VAHELSHWVLVHGHVGGATPDAWRVNLYAGRIVLLASCLALGSLLAILAVPSTERPSGPDCKRTMRASVLPSVGGFLATDIAQRAAAGEHPVPPFMVVLIGLAVYTAIGAGASFLWSCCLRAVLGVSTLFERRGVANPYRRSGAPGSSAAIPRQNAVPVRAGRSPPMPA
jgi:hypothetical protein